MEWNNLYQWSQPNVNWKEREISSVNCIILKTTNGNKIKYTWTGFLQNFTAKEFLLQCVIKYQTQMQCGIQRIFYWHDSTMNIDL